MNLDEMLQSAMTRINSMSDDEFEQELVEAGFELIPNYAQSGEAHVPSLEDEILYNARYTPVLNNPQAYDTFCISGNDANYELDLMVA
ncbi:MAG: hypothetical protein ACJAZP_003216 [Psychromonas sp.]|jgi:hypothetical protein|uniref:hypothetical protein n=1 Tax=Psychromonas sp. TaxID=1884585 RepID=UPI0039E28775